MNKCEWFGHKWEPAYLEGWYGDIHVKFIGVYCKRCRLGFDELHYTNDNMTQRIYGTYSEKYFHRTELPKKL